MPTNHHKASVANLQAKCDAWNAAHPVGTEVSVRKDGGEIMLTKTRSAAEVMGGHSAVIWLDNVRGCYLLDRIKAVVRSQP